MGHPAIDQKAKELKLPDRPPLDKSALEQLMAYHWPGNVRELENLVERAMILKPEGPLSFQHLVTDTTLKRTGVVRQPTDDIELLDSMIADHIRRALERTNGKIHGPAGAAELLGINASTLRARMKKLGIVNAGRREH